MMQSVDRTCSTVGVFTAEVEDQGTDSRASQDDASETRSRQLDGIEYPCRCFRRRRTRLALMTLCEACAGRGETPREEGPDRNPDGDTRDDGFGQPVPASPRSWIRIDCTRRRRSGDECDGGDDDDRPPLHSRSQSSRARRASLRRICTVPSGLGGARPTGLNIFLLLAVAVLLLQPCSAALIAFENCLPEVYKSASNPPALQFVGKYVDASVRDGQMLKVTMWGNVTGSRSRNPLPLWNDTAYWSDDARTEGKIPRIPAVEKGIITTLHSKLEMLSYEPFSHDSDFCANLTVGRCPLAPVFLGNASREQLPSVFMETNLSSSYAYMSWSATFLIKYTDQDAINIGCVSATVTPDMGGLGAVPRYLPAGILGLVGFATIFAAMFSPWGTTDVFRWTSNYGRDNHLLRLVTPGFGDCLQYIQFAVLTAGLRLRYPGFYQPFLSHASWSVLMFNESFVSREPGYQNVRDGIYVANVPGDQLGLHTLAQLTGMGNVADVWAGSIIWLLVMIGIVVTVCQIAFSVRWVYRRVNHIAEEDLRSKNLPFTVGNVVRIVFNYFLLPIVALSTFQLVVASTSPAYTVALAVVTLVLIVGFGAWLSYLILATKPRPFLFDDLPTVLLYGPLYNTYSDEAATFALVPLFLTFMRGIAIGAVQPNGIAQVVTLAICEVVQILSIIAVRPFQKPTSMNAYHTVFTACRLASVLLMVAFVPDLGVTEGPRGWIGQTILAIHAAVLGFGFFLNAVLTILEVAIRLSGAGSDSVKGIARGGLSKIFGMRQLQRREGPSRNSQLSNAAMLDPDETAKPGYIMPGGRLRSESAGSAALLSRDQRSSSALDGNSVDMAYTMTRNFDSGASSFTPTTPGEASTFSFLPSPVAGRHPLAPAATFESAADPYYRPPRRRAPTIEGAGPVTLPSKERQRGSWASAEWDKRRFSQAPPGGLLALDPAEVDGQISRGATPGPFGPQAISFAPRADYSTREADFYYGVRGQRLNSDAPSRKLGTGPADPTGPLSSAAGWFRNMLGGKTKEKGKGFEVVRSSRMPAAMKARGGDMTDDGAPQGIPVAMSMLRNGPIESDDEEDKAGRRQSRSRAPQKQDHPGLLDGEGNPQEEATEGAAMTAPDSPRTSDQPPALPGIGAGSPRLPAAGVGIQSSRRSSRAGRTPAPLRLDIMDEKGPLPAPAIPRKSSRRDSGGGSLPSRDNSRDRSQDLLPFAVVPPGGHQRSQSSTVGASFQNQHPQRHQPSLSVSSSRLPFERNNSQRRLSSSGSASDDFAPVDLHGAGESCSATSNDDRPTSYGVVPKGRYSHIEVDPHHPRHLNFMGSSAEVVDERR